MPRFLDSPAELGRRVERLMGHFRFARLRWDQSGRRGLPTASDLLLILIKDAMYTNRMMPDMDRGRLSKIKSLMPAARFSDRDAYETQLVRLLDGMPAFDANRVRVTVTQDDCDRMVDVLDLFRFVAGIEAGRDSRLVLAAASGLSLEQCARIWDRHRIWGSMRDVKKLIREAELRICGQILQGMRHEFRLFASGPGVRARERVHGD